MINKLIEILTKISKQFPQSSFTYSFDELKSCHLVKIKKKIHCTKRFWNFVSVNQLTISFNKNGQSIFFINYTPKSSFFKNVKIKIK